MKKVIRLTEKGLTNLVRRIVNEQMEDVYSDSREDFQYDIRGVRCDENTFTSGHVDIDEDEIFQELSQARERLRIAIALHLEAVTRTQMQRARPIVRIFRLAGRAPLPVRYPFEEIQV